MSIANQPAADAFACPRCGVLVAITRVLTNYRNDQATFEGRCNVHGVVRTVVR